MQIGGYAILIGQQKQQNVLVGHVTKVMAAAMHCRFFQMKFTSQWTLTLILSMTMRFSPHIEKRNL